MDDVQCLRPIRVECERADAPTLTPSMTIAFSDLKLDELRVIYPGTRRYSLGKRVVVLPLSEGVAASRRGSRRTAAVFAPSPPVAGKLTLTPIFQFAAG